MRAPKRYAVQIIQCMARSDIYEGHYDFYLGCVLSVWIWSVPRDQEPIYQPDSWRFVRWGTSAIPCSHSKTLNIFWRIGIGKAEKCTNWESKKWMTMKFDSRRFLLVIQRPLVSTDWMVKVENPQTFCHLISYRNRIFVSKSLLLPLPSQSPTQLNCRICVCLVSFNSRDFPGCHLHYWHSNSERAKFFSHFLLHLVIEIILSTETESYIN